MRSPRTLGVIGVLLLGLAMILAEPPLRELREPADLAAGLVVPFGNRDLTIGGAGPPDTAIDTVVSAPHASGSGQRSTTDPEASSGDRSPVDGRSHRLADLDVHPVAAPMRLRIGRLAVDAPVQPVGVDADGAMSVPSEVSTVGWYRFGPAPGEAGHAVLAGHVDSRTQGRGVFRALLDVGLGDVVEVGAADGVTTHWRVVQRTLVDKQMTTLDDLWVRSGPPRLVLVTCGGRFDRATRTYRSNVVVVAVPVTDAAHDVE